MVTIRDFIECDRTLAKHCECGYMSPYLDSFADWMEAYQFAKATIRTHLKNVAHFSHWLKDIEFDFSRLDEHIHTFLHEHILACKCKGWQQPRKSLIPSCSLNRFKIYLSECHGFDLSSAHTAYPWIHDEYLSWLQKMRKLENVSIQRQSHCLAKFLTWYKKKTGHKNLRELKPIEVETFFIHDTSRWGKAYKNNLQGTLRSFFDFCFEHGYTSLNFGVSLPSIRSYQLSNVPKKISEDEALKLLKSIDRTTASGKRNYALLLILYNYGVRGCQIRALTLKDIDWNKEEIHFPAVKGSKICSFPLTAEVGNALLDYLQNARNKSRYRNVFLTLKAPVMPLKGPALSIMVRDAMTKAGVESPRRGTHCFRHGFVARMLKQGQSFKHIADLVGHKNIRTTFIYTKIDFDSLSEVALELPEVEYEIV